MTSVISSNSLKTRQARQLLSHTLFLIYHAQALSHFGGECSQFYLHATPVYSLHLHNHYTCRRLTSFAALCQTRGRTPACGTNSWSATRSDPLAWWRTQKWEEQVTPTEWDTTDLSGGERHEGTVGLESLYNYWIYSYNVGVHKSTIDREIFVVKNFLLMTFSDKN